jgi:tungstate transport system ATP-binding protein
MLEAAAIPGRPLGEASPVTGELLPARVRGLTLEVGAKRLIDRVDLSLAAGSVTLVLGPTGAGKSLLLRLLHGMIEPSEGEIIWGGAPLSEAVRRRQAMVFQRPVLLRRSVAANVDFVLKLRGLFSEERRRALLQHVGLAERTRQPARLLSGGEQQLLALARALALEPAVLFLDEPTASLDPASVLRIEEIVLAAHRRGTKVVFVTHDLAQAKRLAGDIIFIHRGRVLEHTPAERFFAEPGTPEARNYLAGRLVL